MTHRNYTLNEAMAVLADSADQSEARSFRHDRATLEAFDLLYDLFGPLPPASAYRAAMALEDPKERHRVVNAAYGQLCGLMGRHIIVLNLKVAA